MRCYLRVGNATLDEAVRYATIGAAVVSFERQAEDLARFGQALSATLHIAKSRTELVEDCDYLLEYDMERERVVRTRC